MGSYPRVEINKKHLKENIDTVIKKCEKFGISVAGVIKGMNGLPELADVYRDSGFSMIGSSRIEQIKDYLDLGVDKPMLMIRIPMKSEAEELVKYCDYSLNSELDTIRAIGDEAVRQGKTHKIILMAEMGDLREGFVGKDEIVEAALAVENDIEGVELAGIGMNVGCYGSILPTREKLDEFVLLAEAVEDAVGHELEIVSGGATSTMMRVMDGDIPEKINHLRVGEEILLARDLDVYYGCDVSDMHQDVFRLKAEVIEVKDKPTFPIGEIGRDAFGHMPEYHDRGIRKRALLGIGRVDYGSDEHELIPVEEGIEILGASSDHTIIDIEDLERELKVGDILEFQVTYASLVYVTSSRSVKIVVNS